MYYVYILASQRNGTLYIGVTNNLAARLALHRSGQGSEFAKRYRVHDLVYAENYDEAEEAIKREKQIKKWNRAWKIRLIERENPYWKDLADLLG